MAHPIPEEPSPLQRIGDVQREHNVSRRSLYMVLILGLVVTGGGATLLGFALADASARNTADGTAAAVIGAALVLLGLLAPLLSWRNRKMRILVGDRGIARVRADGDGNAIEWDAIDALRTERIHFTAMELVPFFSMTVLEIARRNGRTWRIKNVATFGIRIGVIEDFEALLEVAERKVVPRLVNAACSAIQRGETVKFGRIAVDFRGMSAGNKRVRWEQFGELRVERGSIHIYACGHRRPAFRAAWRSTPNPSVLLQLCEHYRGLDRGASASNLDGVRDQWA